MAEIEATVTQKTVYQNQNCFTHQIGNTVFDVSLFFSQTSKETINDKIMRLILNDVEFK